jgi:hypothetical protein
VGQPGADERVDGGNGGEPHDRHVRGGAGAVQLRDVGGAHVRREPADDHGRSALDRHAARRRQRRLVDRPHRLARRRRPPARLLLECRAAALWRRCGAARCRVYVARLSCAIGHSSQATGTLEKSAMIEAGWRTTADKIKKKFKTVSVCTSVVR